MIASTFDKKVDSFEQFRWLTSPELARAVEGFWERAAASPALPCDRLCSQVISVRHEQGPIAYSLEYCEITSSGYFSMTKPRANVDPHINCTPVLTKARATGAVSFLGKTRPALGCYECADLPSRPPNFAFRCTSSSAAEVEATIRRIMSRWSSSPLNLSIETERISAEFFIVQGTRAYQVSQVLPPNWKFTAVSVHIQFNQATAGIEPRYSILVSRQNVPGQEGYRGANAAELSTYKTAFSAAVKAESSCH